MTLVFKFPFQFTVFYYVCANCACKLHKKWKFLQKLVQVIKLCFGNCWKSANTWINCKIGKSAQNPAVILHNIWGLTSRLLSSNKNLIRDVLSSWKGEWQCKFKRVWSQVLFSNKHQIENKMTTHLIRPVFNAHK